MIFTRLSVQAPQHYRTWVRAAIAVTTASYGLAFATIQVEQPWANQAHPRELYVIAAGLAAAWLERKGRLQAAAGLILAAIWLELHLSLLTVGPRAAVGGVFPAVLTGAILFFGARAGGAVALSSLLSVPAFTLAGPWLSLGPGIGPGDLLYLVAIEASTLAIAILLALLMNTLGGVLRNAERDARRVRELIDGAPDAIVTVNHEGVILDCNPSAEVLFRRPRAELIKSSFVTLGLSKAGEGASGEPVLLRDLAAEAREFLGPGAAEARTPLDIVMRTLTREDGSRDRLVVFRDLTLRKAAEAKSAELTRQLQQSQKLEALGKLAGGVAHDFNNLLMAVGGYGEALARHADPRVQSIAANLLGLRQRAAGLTGHLLAFAKKGMTQPRSMDLSRAVSETERLLRPLMGSSIALSVDAPDPAFIYADPAQIEQVLLNLVLNARDAMPTGGALTISCRRRSEAERVELCVTDTGHGMDEATRSAVFEPFFTTKPRTQGTGLGLSLVHGIMEASGGTISVESTPGRGTAFTLSWRALSLGPDTDSRAPELGLQH